MRSPKAASRGSASSSRRAATGPCPPTSWPSRSPNEPGAAGSPVQILVAALEPQPLSILGSAGHQELLAALDQAGVRLAAGVAAEGAAAEPLAGPLVPRARLLTQPFAEHQRSAGKVAAPRLARRLAVLAAEGPPRALLQR